MPLPQNLIDTINRITDEVYESAKDIQSGNLAMLLMTFAEEVIKAAKNAAHEADIEREYHERVGEDQ